MDYVSFCLGSLALCILLVAGQASTCSPTLLALSGVDAGGGLVRQLVHMVASIGGSVQRISICPQIEHRIRAGRRLGVSLATDRSRLGRATAPKDQIMSHFVAHSNGKITVERSPSAHPAIDIDIARSAGAKGRHPAGDILLGDSAVAPHLLQPPDHL